MTPELVEAWEAAARIETKLLRIFEQNNIDDTLLLEYRRAMTRKIKLTVAQKLFELNRVIHHSEQCLDEVMEFCNIL